MKSGRFRRSASYPCESVLLGSHDSDASVRAQETRVAAGEELLGSVTLLVFVETTHDASGIEHHDCGRVHSLVLDRHQRKFTSPESAAPCVAALRASAKRRT